MSKKKLTFEEVISSIREALLEIGPERVAEVYNELCELRPRICVNKDDETGDTFETMEERRGSFGEGVKRIIAIDEASLMLQDFVQNADATDIASIFSSVFGYTVTHNEVDGHFVCTPDKDCGGRLNEADYLIGKEVIVPEPAGTGDSWNRSFEGVVVKAKGVENGRLIVSVRDQDDNYFDIEADRLDMGLSAKREVYSCPLCGWESFAEEDYEVDCVKEGCPGKLTDVREEEYEA